MFTLIPADVHCAVEKHINDFASKLSKKGDSIGQNYSSESVLLEKPSVIPGLDIEEVIYGK